jgi:hypothetical protein
MSIDTSTQKGYWTIFTAVLLNGRRGCRVAEGPALEKRYPAKSWIVGSNPTLSANKIATRFYVTRLRR